MSLNPNKNGRAFEYSILNIFAQNGFSLEYNAKRNLEIYKFHYDSLSFELKNDYDKAAKIFYEWFISNNTPKEKSINSLIDNDGSVADFYISNRAEGFLYSLKHNNDKLRHNRPGGLPKRLGIKDTELSKKYLRKIHNVEKIIRIKNPNEILLNNIIGKEKYMRNLNKITANYLENALKDIDCANKLFNYFIGGLESYNKVILHSNPFKITITDVKTNISPSFESVLVESNGYILLTYKGGWEINMRIHNASSKLGKINSSNPYQVTGDWKWDVTLKSGKNLMTIEI